METRKVIKIAAVRRDDSFSPNSVEKDRLILAAACKKTVAAFEEHGLECSLKWVDEEKLAAPDDADIYLSMARNVRALSILQGFEQAGKCVVNRASGVMSCRRSTLEKVMKDNGIPTPGEPADGEKDWTGAWIKRGDSTAQTREDVVYCPDADALERTKEAFLRRGITEYVVSKHVVGDVVKFYGVADTFFRLYYPTDDGLTKFGDEAEHNGKAHHYAFSVEQLRSVAARLARLLQVDVYGGDAIVDDKGRFYVIDFNDWPSFSRCRSDAAQAIADLVVNKTFKTI